MTDIAATTLRRHPRWLRLVTGRDLWTGILARMASRVRRGELTLRLPDGRTMCVGDPAGGPRADLTLLDDAAARRLMLGGGIGMAEAYGDGLWRSDDLPALIELAIHNEAELGSGLDGSLLAGLVNRLFHRSRANSRRGSRRNIAFHYDLGNDFYRLWLDPGMTYSSALYEGEDQSLEQAQDAKIARAADLLRLGVGDRVLEIGCGWGGMAEHLAARRGAAVVGLTLSAEQLAFAGTRMERAGLADRVDLRLMDYRDVGGSFDRIVSIEMIEAVGEEHWPRYFATLRDRLVPGGAAVIQAITIDDARFPLYRRNCDFIQRHIFPGGLLPCPSALRAEAARAGLVVDHVESFGASYARTCAEWRRRFHAAEAQVAALGFDARFRRLWDYYLAYCEAGFRAGTIDVGFWRFRRPDTRQP
ncbi:cyclopropane-fatty-acyl-phospholipid synthase (plasmid) [Azospirillum sp. B510]|uniref:SAM-dependent methyltransferase n=1 Tax=Azospirillum sp. (strain B510) TaxID=137722 RepID=UPI0001C4C61A|nr:cyclopropane-fatty-acyl-phospholipid synthase family protein [Azospirillum sp. B510]BAI76014.1 cyclopropane-fatty-acyl-phospholipid synthase [Azospirillum sp. B510]